MQRKLKSSIIDIGVGKMFIMENYYYVEVARVKNTYLPLLVFNCPVCIQQELICGEAEFVEDKGMIFCTQCLSLFLLRQKWLDTETWMWELLGECEHGY